MNTFFGAKRSAPSVPSLMAEIALMRADLCAADLTIKALKDEIERLQGELAKARAKAPSLTSKGKNHDEA